MMMSLSIASPVHLGDEAACPTRCISAQAGVGAGIQLVPERAGLGKRRQFGAVAGLRRLLPGRDRAVLFDLFQAAQHRLVGQVVELLAAQIVVAPLHVADVQLAFAVGKKRLLEKRNIFVEELFLQILGSGGNDHALARANHGHQVSQRLAGAGAGFDDQVTLLFQRLLDRLRHLQLSAAKFVGRMRARKHSARREELVQRNIAFLGVETRAENWKAQSLYNRRESRHELMCGRRSHAVLDSTSVGRLCASRSYVDAADVSHNLMTHPT